METTIELLDGLSRKAKATASLNGRKLKNLVEEVAAGARSAAQRRRQCKLAELMAGARGMIDSGIANLGSNPRHLKGFGRDAGDR